MTVTQAQQLMTRDVAAVGPDSPTQQVARLLPEHRISAVPVVDPSGAPIGMVSEGDLVGRNEADRQARRDWWLDLLAEGEPLNAEFLASVGRAKRTARDIMSAPVVTIDEATTVQQIARILEEHRIKRVPVVRDGRMVGIVSRADLVRALSAEPLPEANTMRHYSVLSAAIAGLDRTFGLGRQPQADGAPSAQPSEAKAEPTLNAADFERLGACLSKGDFGLDVAVGV